MTEPTQPTTVLEHVSSAGSFQDTDLTRRAQETGASDFTSHYRVVKNDLEVALVVIDRRRDLSALIIYDLFVIKRFRSQGLGSAILTLLEGIAAKEGFKSARLCPTQIDSEWPRERLIQWYLRRGFEFDPSNGTEMQKDTIRCTEICTSDDPSHSREW